MSFLQKIFQAIEIDPQTEIDGQPGKANDQTIGSKPAEIREQFDINNYKKTCLLNGYDDIDYLLSIKEEIEQFETDRYK